MYGVGVALWNSIAVNFTESPIYISERLVTLCIHSVRGEYATIIIGFAPTLCSDEDEKDLFYESLNKTIRHVPKSDKLILMGDFNARIGKGARIRPEVIARHGVGRMITNGLRSLTICIQLDLSITDTFFRLKNKHKPSWMRPRSRNWHLIDSIIVRRWNTSCVTRARATRGAQYASDHRLIVSDICWKIRPKSRLQQPRTKKTKRNYIHDPCKRADFQEKNREELQSTFPPEVRDSLAPISLEESCTQKRHHRDWFYENDFE